MIQSNKMGAEREPFQVEAGDDGQFIATRGDDGSVTIETYGCYSRVYLNPHKASRLRDWVMSSFPAQPYPAKPDIGSGWTLDLTGEHTRLMASHHGNQPRGPWSVFVLWRGDVVFGLRFRFGTLDKIMTHTYHGLTGAFHVLELLRPEQSEELQEVAQAVLAIKDFAKQKESNGTPE